MRESLTVRWVLLCVCDDWFCSWNDTAITVSVPAGLDATVSVSVLVVEQRVTKIDALSYMRPVALGIIDNMPLDVVGGMMIRLYAQQVRDGLIWQLAYSDVSCRVLSLLFP